MTSVPTTPVDYVDSPHQRGNDSHNPYSRTAVNRTAWTG